MPQFTQDPVPGSRRLYFCGDMVDFYLECDSNVIGKAYLRTDLGNGQTQRDEIINRVEQGVPLQFQHWHDVEMTQVGDGKWHVRVGLLEPGHFEAKCCFIPEGKREPLWPAGENVAINVEPASYCTGNTIYCAFVRQFGPNKEFPYSRPLTNVKPIHIEKLDHAGYSVIPPSGTFRGLMKELDFIVGELNCRILHLLPINPTPTVYARMGRYGSPYASLDFTAIDPSLAEFDRKATPLDQFLELVDAVHQRGAKLFVDIAINHTGWAAKIHEEHPEWLVREKDGSIHSPGAWGVTWGDLTELDHKRKELWSYLADMFLVWCARGVDGFRCDAGYMIPVPAWEYIIAKTRKHYPSTIFLLEGLGGDPKVTRELLNKANMNWAYSELFQNYDAKQIESYLSYSDSIGREDGLMVHYAETHDNNRLAATSKTYARMRTALSALLSTNGAFGFANGVEWFATEKIDVHEARALNWGAEENQVTLISRLNRLLTFHPAFHSFSKQEFLPIKGSESVIAVLRSDRSGNHQLLILFNLDCERVSTFQVGKGAFKCASGELYDVLQQYAVPVKSKNKNWEFVLKPGEFCCLAHEPEYLADLKPEKRFHAPRVDEQIARAWALEAYKHMASESLVVNTCLQIAWRELLDNPLGFVRGLVEPGQEVKLVQWRWPHDLHRQVLLPPDHMIMVSAEAPFRAKIVDGQDVLVVRDSVRRQNSQEHFVLLQPIRVPDSHRELRMDLAICEEAGFQRESASLLLLADRPLEGNAQLSAEEIRFGKYTFLVGNGRGGVSRPSVQWAELRSRYDALLLANLSPDFPEDRHIMFRRCRAWLSVHGRTYAFDRNSTAEFNLTQEGGAWSFRLPVGDGRFVLIRVVLSMVQGRNAVRMRWIRLHQDGRRDILDDSTPVYLILRPDIEDRNFHHETKASHGPEDKWPKCIHATERGFAFQPDESRELNVAISAGDYHASPEWHYSIYHEVEASRGLESHSDLYSPGYFSVRMLAGDDSELLGQVLTPMEPEKLTFTDALDYDSLSSPVAYNTDDLFRDALLPYVVKRGELKTVIAGYPWFLDWGRDTLICVRGLIAAGMLDDVRLILLQFARFAENGTLPNMIHGDNAENRDTSDAPLWFFVACEDMCKVDGNREFLKTQVPGRKETLLEVLTGLVEGYIAGTPNGITVDSKSKLVFSPSHFTWMDTNYPAGTPREGYPIEIQAFWFAALRFLGEATGNSKWTKMSESVRAAVLKYFMREDGYLADCLHGKSGTPAADAVADDHLRPNQLFALTLGLVDDIKQRQSILQQTASLLVPGGIRTLDSKPVSFVLPVKSSDGHLLNNPNFPYWGHYLGDEDSRRKPAYHNGTAWTWPFPSYCEAYYQTYGEAGKRTANAVLASARQLFRNGCFGQIPEILDGDYPHDQRGCDAQAWGVTEFYRIWKLLAKEDVVREAGEMTMVEESLPLGE